MAARSHTPRGALHLGARAHLEAALADWLRAVKAGDPFRAVLVVTGSNLACGQLSRSLSARLTAHAGVRFVSIHALASRLAAADLAAADIRPLSPLLRERLVAGLVRARRGRRWYFEPVSAMPGLPLALARTLDDLREAHVPPEALGAVASRKVAHLAALYGDYVAELQRRHLADDTGLYELAAAAVRRGDPPAEVPVAVFGIYDLPGMQAELVAALAATRQLAAFVPWGDAVSSYAQAARVFFEGLGLAVHTPDGAGDDRGDIGAADADVGGAELQIVSVADDVAQRRAVVTEVLKAAERGLPFHDIAVVAADAAGRDRLAGALQAQAVPVAARRANDSAAARTCRLLLDCLLPAAGRPLRREAVIDLAATAPRLSPVAGSATVALWDRLSRRARVVADDEWRDRLWREEHLVRWRLGAGAVGDQSLELDALSSLAAFVARLAGVRRALSKARSWQQAAAVFLDAACAVCGVPRDDPVCGALAELAVVTLVDDTYTSEAFATAARHVLARLDLPTERRVGRDGVAVVSPHQLRGLSFRLVVVCDLAEGGFPLRPAPDPILLDGEREVVSAACGARLAVSASFDDENGALFALMLQAAGERIVLLYPRLEATTGRPRLPSRALLQLARERLGRPVSFEELDADGGLGGLVRRVGAGPGAPVDLRDLDLGVLVAAARPSRAASPAWLRAYAAEVLGEERAERGAAATAGRRRAALGPWDGVLSPENAARAAADLLGKPVSPSAIESYLSCPFGFYLRYVLGLEVPDEPDDVLSIAPVDLGSVVHEALRRAYETAAEPTAAAVGAALNDVAASVFARAEARGLTGFPLAWQVLRDELLDDLHRVVQADACWRDGLVPSQFEWQFDGEDAPSLRIGARELRFRGRIDRIDRAADGGTVRLVDYKTGRGDAEAERVKAGHDVQLPVYVLALAAGGEGVARVRAEYRMVRRRSGFAEVALTDEFDVVREQLAATVAVAVGGIEAGLFPRWPSRTCRYCEASASCGVDRLAFAVKRADPRLAPLQGFKDPKNNRANGASS
jgi:RecB family exonuclease/superfamily I DNA/RNA helicase